MRKITISFALLSALTFLPTALRAQEKPRPRVFIEESSSWEVTGETGGIPDGFGGSVRGGARPQTTEIIKTFGERCACVVTSKKEKADYVVRIEHEGGKDIIRKDNKYVVFDKDGDAIASGSTRSLGNAVKNACAVIAKDQQEKALKTSAGSATQP